MYRSCAITFLVYCASNIVVLPKMLFNNNEHSYIKQNVTRMPLGYLADPTDSKQYHILCVTIMGHVLSDSKC